MRDQAYSLGLGDGLLVLLLLLLLPERRQLVAVLQIVGQRARQYPPAHRQDVLWRVLQHRRGAHLAALQTTVSLGAAEVVVLRTVEALTSLQAAVALLGAAQVLVIRVLRMVAHAGRQDARRHGQHVGGRRHRVILLGGVREQILLAQMVHLLLAL